MSKSKRHSAPPRPRILVLEGLSGSAGCVRQAGGDAVTVSPRDLSRVNDALLEGVADGLLLTGGGDVDPRRYRQRPHRMTYGVSQDRDECELDAVRWAVAVDLPVLGICRGAQVMNVAAGGTLRQHLADRLGVAGAAYHRGCSEAVRFLPHSLAGEAVGMAQTRVMHIHHQAVGKVGAGYRASAWHRDGTVEAIESTDGVWRVGVQFHPEYVSTDAPERGLFRQLVVQAALRANLPVPAVRVPRTKPKAAAPKSVRLAPARTATVLPTKVRKFSEVLTTWRCFRCQIDFDERNDYVDHMYELHDVDLIGHALEPVER